MIESCMLRIYRIEVEDALVSLAIHYPEQWHFQKHRCYGTGSAVRFFLSQLWTFQVRQNLDEIISLCYGNLIPTSRSQNGHRRPIIERIPLQEGT